MPATEIHRKPPGRQNLAKRLTELGIAKSDLAMAVEVSRFSITRVVAGTQKPSKALQERIAVVLGEDDIEWLFAVDVEAVALAIARAS